MSRKQRRGSERDYLEIQHSVKWTIHHSCVPRQSFVSIFIYPKSDHSTSHRILSLDYFYELTIPTSAIVTAELMPRHRHNSQHGFKWEVRDDIPKKSCCSFGFFSKLPPPPPCANLNNLYNFFQRQNSRFESQFRTKNALYTI